MKTNNQSNIDIKERLASIEDLEIRGAIRLREIMRKKEYTVADRKFLLEINKESE